MAGQFEQLLVDVSRQVGATAEVVEGVARRVNDLSEDVGDLRERVAKLEALQDATKEWNGEERRKVDERLGSGDQTFKRLMTETQQAKQQAQQAVREARHAKALVAGLLDEAAKAQRRTSSRWWTVWKIALQAAIPLGVSGVAWLILSAFAKRGA